MAVQTATTGNLANAQAIIIKEARYTQEANAPSWQLIEKMTLPSGASTVRVPKVGTYTISDVADGTDLSTSGEQAIGMTTVDLTASERGAMVVLTDKLVRQNGRPPSLRWSVASSVMLLPANRTRMCRPCTQRLQVPALLEVLVQR